MVRVIAADRVKELVSPALAMAAAREALIAAAGESISYPVSLFPIDGSGKRISVKSAVFEAIPGIKIGTLWPLNPGAGLPSHGSSILLFDPENGCLRVVVEAGSVNALRTAAADAVATAALARPDASTLCIKSANCAQLLKLA